MDVELTKRALTMAAEHLANEYNHLVAIDDHHGLDDAGEASFHNTMLAFDIVDAVLRDDAVAAEKALADELSDDDEPKPLPEAFARWQGN